MNLVRMQTKTCEGPCALALPLAGFYPHPKGGHSPLCRTCTVADNKLRRQDPEGHKRALAERKQKKLSAKEAFAASISEKVCTKCEATKPVGDFREHRGLYGRSSWCLECERVEGNKYVDVHRDEINAKKRETWANTEFTAEQRNAASEKSRAWYALPENKEHAKARYKAYYAHHKAEIIAYIKAWRKANPEKCREYYATWYETNKEVVAAYSKRYYQEHPDRHRQWVIRNPERSREIKRRWHVANGAARRMAAQFRASVYVKGDLDFDTWLEILDVFDHLCAYCLRSEKEVKLTLDHLVPISKGGEHTESNVVPACLPCNLKKGARSILVMLNQSSPKNVGESHAG